MRRKGGRSSVERTSVRVGRMHRGCVGPTRAECNRAHRGLRAHERCAGFSLSPGQSRIESGELPLMAGEGGTTMFGAHWYQFVIVLGVALLFFGPKRLPEMGSSIGKTIKEFQRSMKEVTEPSQE